MQANSKITELETKLTELRQELTALRMQDKRTSIVWDDQYGFLGSDSEPTSSRSSWKRKKGQAFPLAISYGGFFLSEASTSVLADKPMPMMLASSSQAVVSQITLPWVNPPTLRIASPWGKVLGHICLYAYMHKVNSNIFRYFFRFYSCITFISLFAHCSNFFRIFPYFSCHFIHFKSLSF